jgi:hypothetical protein
MMEKVDMRVEVNNNADFVISLSEANPENEGETNGQVYFEKGSLFDSFDDKEHKKRSRLDDSILMKKICKKATDDQQVGFRKVFCPDVVLSAHDTKEHKDIRGLTLNSKCIIFWTQYRVFALPFADLMRDHFHVSETDFELITAHKERINELKQK